ncbi:MAG TPA: NifU family protein [Limnochordia bacterium]
MSETKVAALEEKVQAALDMIRPALQADGGDVQLVSVAEDGTVQLELVGACHGCPMSMLTLKAGIERALAKLVPEVTAVETV